MVVKEVLEGIRPADFAEPRRRLSSTGERVLTTLAPLILALVVVALVIGAVGRDPIAFYVDIVKSGLLSWNGFQESVNRMGPLFLVGAGLIACFRTNIWNLGTDGQFLLGATMVAGVGTALLGAGSPTVVMSIVVLVIAGATGAAWTLFPAWLKIRYNVSEIITTFLMSAVGLSIARFLIKFPFRDPASVIDQTRYIPVPQRLPFLPGTRIHICIIVGLVAIIGVHYMMTRTSVGMQMDVLGMHRRGARHAGFRVSGLMLLAFTLSGALIGMGGGLSILGDWGGVRPDWNPAWGFQVIPFIFLGRKNGITTAFFIAFLSVMTIGLQTAARKQNLPLDFSLVVTGLIMLFFTISEWAEGRRERVSVEL